MTKSQLISMVELCYAVASQADISPQPMIICENTLRADDGSAVPNVVFNSVRMQTYMTLLSNLLPKQIEGKEGKEPWQE